MDSLWRVKDKTMYVYCRDKTVFALEGYFTTWDIVSHPLFADADTGIYPHAASQYHVRPKAKHGIA